MKKKFIFSLMPLVLAILIVVGLLFIPTKSRRLTKTVMDHAATSMGINVLKGNFIKNQAMSSGEYIPFFGSSELSRIDPFHPFVLANKYNRDYKPFLLGAPGTQSLSHYSILQSMGEELEGEKIVFIISPQWFVKDGVNPSFLSLYFSPLQTYQWLTNIEAVGDAQQYYASRLLAFPDVCSDTTLKGYLQIISNGGSLSEKDKKRCAEKMKLLSREDHIFGQIGMTNKDHKVKKMEKYLPDAYDFSTLDDLAYEYGKEHSSNNKYQINNDFYLKKLKIMEGSLKGSQKDFDYVSSPEFSDFQLILDEIAKRNIEPIFIITPVNKKWSDYTGLSQEMMKSFSNKITSQLTSQGFENVVNLVEDGGEDYFMQDTIHIGVRGWLAIDREVEKFLSSPDWANHEEKASYHLDSKYFKEEWQTNKNF